MEQALNWLGCGSWNGEDSSYRHMNCCVPAWACMWIENFQLLSRAVIFFLNINFHNNYVNPKISSGLPGDYK